METMTKGRGTPLGNTRAASDLMPPKFDTVEAERKHRKQRLAAAFRLFAHFGYDEGLAGHITVRDPEHPDRFWVNPLGVHFAHITSADLVLVSHEGKVIEGGRPVNAAAFAIHSAIHKARPDVIAAAHAHSIHGRTWSTFGRLLDPITQDACAFYEDHAVFDCYTGVGDGHWLPEESELQEGKTHAASHRFDNSLGDDENEGDKSETALG